MLSIKAAWTRYMGSTWITVCLSNSTGLKKGPTVCVSPGNQPYDLERDWHLELTVEHLWLASKGLGG